MGFSVIDAYVKIVKKGYLSIEEIPERYRDEVIKAMGDNENE